MIVTAHDAACGAPDSSTPPHSQRLAPTATSPIAAKRRGNIFLSARSNAQGNWFASSSDTPPRQRHMARAKAGLFSPGPVATAQAAVRAAVDARPDGGPITPAPGRSVHRHVHGRPARCIPTLLDQRGAVSVATVLAHGLAALDLVAGEPKRHPDDSGYLPPFGLTSRPV